MANGDKRSPWFYVAIGCAALILVLVAAVVGTGYVFYRWGKDLEASIKDPVVREQKVRSLLNVEDFPNGYHPVLAFSLPVVLDLAVLSDEEAAPDGEVQGFKERGFIFLKMYAFGELRRDIQDFVEGKKDEMAALKNSNIEIQRQELIDRGRFIIDDGELMYTAYRGEIQVEKHRLEGVTTLFVLDCPADDKVRMGLWFGPDPDPEKEVQAADFSGSPADELALRDFLSHFHLCGP